MHINGAVTSITSLSMMVTHTGLVTTSSTTRHSRTWAGAAATEQSRCGTVMFTCKYFLAFLICRVSVHHLALVLHHGVVHGPAVLLLLDPALLVIDNALDA